MVDKKETKATAKVEKKAATKGSPGGEVKKETVEKAKPKAVEKKPAKKQKKSREEIEAEIRSLDILKYPLITEKAVNMIEAENKLIFVVNKNATKPIVKEAVEKLYKVKVSKVNIIKDMKSRKKAIVTISKEFKADDIATKLGVI